VLNQREYCEAHGLPLKRFGNWRASISIEYNIDQLTDLNQSIAQI
jgi:hypothetical protein